MRTLFDYTGAERTDGLLPESDVPTTDAESLIGAVSSVRSHRESRI